MGGVSQGRVVFKEDQGEQYAHMTGQVSTENNGGFIQLRKAIPKKTIDTATGAYLKVRGNGQQYLSAPAHQSAPCCPGSTIKQASLQQTSGRSLKCPSQTSPAQGSWLSDAVKPKSIRSIGIVAFGREHSADIQIAEIGFY